MMYSAGSEVDGVPAGPLHSSACLTCQLKLLACRVECPISGITVRPGPPSNSDPEAH
jgi:hypothetical protein